MADMANRVWKLNGRRGIAYLEDKAVAEWLISLSGCEAAKLPDMAMAVYKDRRGRTFAWQIPFDLSQWDTVSARVEGREQPPSIRP